jgi:putative membrane protein
MRAFGIVAIVLLGLVVLMPLLGGFGHMGYGMGPRFAGGYGDGPWGWGPGFLVVGGLLKILFIVGLVLFIGAFLRHGGPRWHGPAGMGWHGPVESPLDILKRRLAKGEISREDYESLKTELS